MQEIGMLWLQPPRLPRWISVLERRFSYQPNVRAEGVARPDGSTRRGVGAAWRFREDLGFA